MTIGHMMLDIDEYVLTAIEKELLRHPQVGGVILFTKNYESKKQLRALTKHIRQLAPDCLIAVDQEGGRVQRFRNDFLPLPPFQHYGKLYQENSKAALKEAEGIACTMAKELMASGVDLSFTPVLDLDRGLSEIIGDRSFHHKVETVIVLARAFIKGMHRAGMPATGKHFPGHGGVSDDSHVTLPVDQRDLAQLQQEDLQPFVQLANELDAVMPGHILFDRITNDPPCFSSYWLQDILRTQLKFAGVIFSDDLTMAGAEIAGDFVQRSNIALQAGCDMIIVCHQRQQAIAILDNIENYSNKPSQQRLKTLRKRYD